MRIVVVEDNELYKNELLQCLEQEESDIDRGECVQRVRRSCADRKTDTG